MKALPADAFARPAAPARQGERLRVLALNIAYWLALQILWFTFRELNDPSAYTSAADAAWRIALCIVTPSELLITTLGGLICHAVYEGLRAADGVPLLARLALAAALTTAGAFAFSLSINLISVNVDARFVGPFGLSVTVEALRWFAPIGVWTAIALSITYNAEILAHQQRLSAVRAQAHAAQIRALHFQLNPHFLYNTLNAISALILDRRTGPAERMVLGLAAFLRETLNRDPLETVPLAREIALQRLYLDIEAVRFPEGLEIAIDLPDDVADARVPGLILQPLVENALRHGVPEPGARMRLSLAARAGPGATVVIEVSDNGPGSQGPSIGGGIGLANVRDRIALHGGGAARLDLLSDARGFTARVTLPLVRA